MPDSVFILNDNEDLLEASQQQINFKNIFDSNPDVIRLYRGEKLSNFITNYNLTTERGHLGMAKQLAAKMFMVGLKAKCYTGARVAKSQNDILHEVEEISDAVFIKIYKLLCQVSFSRGLQQRSGNNFRSDNPNFLNSLEKMNYEKFISKIRPFNNSEKSLVRDYYLALLHQLAEKPYKDQSALVSATADKDQAMDFARGRNQENLEFVLINYFIPKPFDAYAVGPYTVNSDFYKNFLKEHGLPSIEKEPYAYEKEFSVRRALFPHFILSFQIISYIDGGSSIEMLNPYISKDEISAVIRSGFNVDQQRFFQVIQGTEYERTGHFDGVQFRTTP